MTCLLVRLVCMLAMARLASAIPIDNRVVGEPEIACLGNAISVNINTDKSWKGTLYARDRYATGEGCLKLGDSSTFAHIELNYEFNECGVRRERTLDPPGVLVTVAVVINFHPRVLTKAARVIRAQCFYMAADKMVSDQFEVNTLPSEVVTQQIPMPVCALHVLWGEEMDAAEVRASLIGQEIWLHWKCETEFEDRFCAQPHSCVMYDNANRDSVAAQSIQFTDDAGCPIDQTLLFDKMERVDDLWWRAKMWSVKFADRPNVFYSCQMEITLKEDGACPPPACGDQFEFGRSKRQTIGGNRTLAEQSVQPANGHFVIDFLENDTGALPTVQPMKQGEPQQGAVCLSTTARTALAVIFWCFFVVLSAFICVLLRENWIIKQEISSLS